jgi:hypothetical protein
LTSVSPLVEQDVVASLHVQGNDLALLVTSPWTHGDHLAASFFLGSVWMMPPVVLSSVLSRRMTTPSCKGRKFIEALLTKRRIADAIAVHPSSMFSLV